MFRTEWGKFIHAYVAQLVHAPRSAAYQNGMAERAARSLKAGIRAIMTQGGARPSQMVLTQAVVARNHVPHTVAETPTALATTGRCGLLSGHAATTWAQNPDTANPAVRQSNAQQHILAARTAVLRADAETATTTCLQRNPPGSSSHEFYSIGETVQIALRGAWVGSWKVAARANSNLVLERGRKVAKMSRSEDASSHTRSHRRRTDS